MRRKIIERTPKTKEKIDLSNVINQTNLLKSDIERLEGLKISLGNDIADLEDKCLECAKNLDKIEDSLKKEQSKSKIHLKDIEKDIKSKIKELSTLEEDVYEKKSNKDMAIKDCEKEQSKLNDILKKNKSLLADKKLISNDIEKEKDILETLKEQNYIQGELIKTDKEKQREKRNLYNKALSITEREVRNNQKKAEEIKESITKAEDKYNSILEKTVDIDTELKLKKETIEGINKEILQGEIKIQKQKEENLHLVQKEQMLNTKESEIKELYKKAGLTI